MAPFLQVFKAFIQSFGDMGDIIDMAIKANDGKATYDVGELINTITTGTIASITALSTKDLYLAGAFVSIESNDASATGGPTTMWQVHLMRNTTTLEIFSSQYSFFTGAVDNIHADHSFMVKGAKVTTSETFRLVLAQASASVDVYGTIYGWQEDTGVGPEI